MNVILIILSLVIVCNGSVGHMVTTTKPSPFGNDKRYLAQEPTDSPTESPTAYPDPPTTGTLLPICVDGALGGVFVIQVPCNIGDWSCQGKYVCQAVLGTTCEFQPFCCCDECEGSWFNAGVGFMYFHYDWDINDNGGTAACTIPGYGNICGDVDFGLFTTYNLSSAYIAYGYGNWYRDGYCPTMPPTDAPTDSPTDPPTDPPPTDPPTDSPTDPPPTDPPPTDPPTDPPPTESPTEPPPTDPDPPTTASLMTICVSGGLGGERLVDVPCGTNDYQCQGKYVCQAVLGQPCQYQSYCCCGSCTGSWHNPSVGYLYFNYDWDISDNGGAACPTPNYGNICGSSPSIFSSYNLSSAYNSEGYGNWYRNGICPTSPPTEPPPTEPPTDAPPTDNPTEAPTDEPPTEAPTETPTTEPTAPIDPTEAPTSEPTEEPTNTPTNAPTPPTNAPTKAPTKTPTLTPSSSPTNTPTKAPTLVPSSSPTVTPTLVPSSSPTIAPTTSPTDTPTVSPTLVPSTSPTDTPTESPTLSPSSSPTDNPSTNPTVSSPSTSQNVSIWDIIGLTMLIYITIAIMVTGLIMYIVIRVRRIRFRNYR